MSKKFNAGIFTVVLVLIAILGMALLTQRSPESVDVNGSVIQTPVTSKVAGDLSLNSSNVLLVERNENLDVLLDIKSDERIYPASLAKIMTAIVALENISDLDELVTLREEIFNPLYSANASMAGFSPGEKVRAIDLLFTNMTGLHNNDQYSTARDISVLLEYAIQSEIFFKILTAQRYTAKPTNLNAEGISFLSTLFSEMESPEFNGGTILGGKTGSTNEAGLCLASIAEKGARQFILVTCGAKAVNDSQELSPPLSAPGGLGRDTYGGSKTEELHIDDAFTVYNAIIITEGR
ncbi:peptidase M15 [Clostridia bacterium]|nr:peptidase M15 [Clostridia bacterium]